MTQALDLTLNPGRFRLVLALAAIVGVALIGLSYLASLQYIRHTAEEGLRNRIGEVALLHEDQVSRSLDSVATQVRALAALHATAEAAQATLASPELQELMARTPVIRSLSLIDAEGLVLASSVPDNVGRRVPARVLPPDAGALGELRFGPALPFRDLAELAQDRREAGASLWVAALAADPEAGGRRWIAVINPSFFETFWARLQGDGRTAVRLYSVDGRLLAWHDPARLTDESLDAPLREKASGSSFGTLEQAGAAQQLLVAYRVSRSHPVILAVAGERLPLGTRLARDHPGIAMVAGAAAVLVLVLLGLVLRWYLRFESALVAQGNQARAIAAHLLVCDLDLQGRVTDANPAFVAVCGRSREALLGQTHPLFRTDGEPQSLYTELWSTLRAGRIWKGTLHDRRPGGELYWLNTTVVPFTDAWGQVTRFVALCTDVSEAIALGEKFNNERRRREKLVRINRELLTEANTDALTGLSNRRALNAFFAEAMATSSQDTKPMSVLVLDLDHFKTVNDTWGHAAGDQVLTTLARRWSAQIRGSDMLCRLGGEEFAVILPQTSAAQAELVARKLLAVTASEPVRVGYEDSERVDEIHVTVSAGLASTDWPARASAAELLEAADQALYEAKHGGRNRIITRRIGP